MAEAQAVQVNLTVRDGHVVLLLATPGVGDLPIAITPQAAYELGEKMARAAHEARFGEPAQSDVSYLHEQIKARCTEDMRMMLVQRLSVMLNSIREDRAYSNGRLAGVLVDTVLTKVA